MMSLRLCLSQADYKRPSTGRRMVEVLGGTDSRRNSDPYRTRRVLHMGSIRRMHLDPGRACVRVMRGRWVRVTHVVCSGFVNAAQRRQVNEATDLSRSLALCAVSASSSENSSS